MSKSSPKVDNHQAGRAAKIEIRRAVLEGVGADKAHVFDAFCGLGEMRAAVWRQAASWVGCDRRPWSPSREQPRFIANNLDVMRVLDLAKFNVFDFDAYGSPWENLLLLLDHRPWAPGERGGVVITDGSGRFTQAGVTEHDLGRLLGLRRYHALRGQRLAANRAGVTEWIKQAGVRVLRRLEAQRPGGSGVLYAGLVFEGGDALSA